MSEQCEQESPSRCGSGSAEQLDELRLLTRADHHGGSSRLGGPGLAAVEDLETGDEDEEATALPEPSSFTALFAASRRLAGSNTPPGIADSSSNSDENSRDRPTASPVATEARARRPTFMPTLSEEEPEDCSNSSSEENTPRSLRDDEAPHAEAVSRLALSLPRRDASPVAESTSREQSDGNVDDGSPLDPAFADMLHQLRYDLSFLALSASDLTVRNLVLVRDALASLSGEDHCSVQKQRDERPLIDKMRLIRTIMAVDTLRLLVLRYNHDDVLLAVTSSVRRIFDKYVSDHGVGPMAHSFGVLTSRNIARAVLLTREHLELKQRERVSAGNNNNNNRPELSSPGRCSSKSNRDSSRPGSPASRHPSTNSPSRAASPTRSYSSGLSPARSSVSGGGASSSSSLASPRRSILASDGAHVLMNEKLAAYQHRPGGDRIPSMKVRRDSTHIVEEAARRRQRSIHYGRESTRLLAEATNKLK